MSTRDEIKYIRDTDQSDLTTMYLVINLERDQIRLQRVKVLYRAGQITEPWINTAPRLFINTDPCADDYGVAYELAKAAQGHGAPKFFPPLSHLAYDRWQLSLGKQQTYGRQLMPVPIKRAFPTGQ